MYAERQNERYFEKERNELNIYFHDYAKYAA